MRDFLVSRFGFRASISTSRPVSHWPISNQTASILRSDSGRAIGGDCGQSSSSMKSFFPVCSPSFNGGRLPRDLASMLSEPLLIDRNLSWRTWFKSAGLKLDSDILGTSFTDTNALMEAAVTGQGIALGRNYGGKVCSPFRAQLARFLQSLCRLPELLRIKPSFGGLPRLVDRRGQSLDD